MEVRTLYLITGPAGVGKSTVSKIIAENMEKSALIEGDDIYHLVKGGYVSPWLEGNHLEVFWKNSIDMINNFLEKGYDVVFNYIIEKDKLDYLINSFVNIEIKFVVLMVNQKTIVKRDKKRPVDYQMGERSLELLNAFKKEKYEDRYILDTSNLSIEETVTEIETNKRFIL